MASSWDGIAVLHSTDDKVSKFVFTKPDAVAEAVLYRYPSYVDRTVICCSTMSGCMVGCRFCGAGDHYVRNLTALEIIDQVHACLISTGVESVGHIRQLQIMFMSMGEPMLNFKQVAIAIEYLHDIFPHAELLISTMGPVGNYTPLFDLSHNIDKVGLQFSIHESTDAARSRLIPFRNKLDLIEIATVGARWAQFTGRQAFFNYCVHEGNVSPADADRLRNLFHQVANGSSGNDTAKLWLPERSHHDNVFNLFCFTRNNIQCSPVLDFKAVRHIILLKQFYSTRKNILQRMMIINRYRIRLFGHTQKRDFCSKYSCKPDTIFN